MLSAVADVDEEVILLLLLSERGLFILVEILSPADDFIVEFSPLLLLLALGLANDLSSMFFAIIILLVVVGIYTIVDICIAIVIAVGFCCANFSNHYL